MNSLLVYVIVCMCVKTCDRICMHAVGIRMKIHKSDIYRER